MSWLDARAKLLDAMIRAEGGPDAFVRAVRCSIPDVVDYDDARKIATTTITHATWDYAMRDPAAFIAFLGARWAPVGAANDPMDLNKNWIGNVTKGYEA